MEHAWQFFRDTMRIAPPAGRLDVRTQYQFNLDGEASGLVLDGIDVLLSGLALAMEDNETPAIALEKLHLSESRFDLEKRQLDIGKLIIADGWGEWDNGDRWPVAASGDVQTANRADKERCRYNSGNKSTFI